jgi:hypothetical protein
MPILRKGHLVCRTGPLSSDVLKSFPSTHKFFPPFLSMEFAREILNNLIPKTSINCLGSLYFYICRLNSIVMGNFTSYVIKIEILWRHCILLLPTSEITPSPTAFKDPKQEKKYLHGTFYYYLPTYIRNNSSAFKDQKKFWVTFEPSALYEAASSGTRLKRVKLIFSPWNLLPGIREPGGPARSRSIRRLREKVHFVTYFFFFRSLAPRKPEVRLKPGRRLRREWRRTSWPAPRHSKRSPSSLPCRPTVSCHRRRRLLFVRLYICTYINLQSLCIIILLWASFFPSLSLPPSPW